MNREQLLSVYYQNKPNTNKISVLCTHYPELLEEKLIEPEFVLLAKINSTQKMENETQDNTSITTSISFCSNFSRITMDRVIFADILRKRKEHQIFIVTEAADSLNIPIWYYEEDKSGNIIGAFSPIEMSRRFELGILNENTKLKKKYDDSSILLSTLIKRYFKNFLSSKLEIQKLPVNLSRKVVNFKKGEAMKAPGKIREVFEHRNREERFFSETVRPNLIDLKKLLPSDFDEGEFEVTRIRSHTDPLKSCKAN